MCQLTLKVLLWLRKSFYKLLTISDQKDPMRLLQKIGSDLKDNFV